MWSALVEYYALLFVELLDNITNMHLCRIINIIVTQDYSPYKFFLLWCAAGQYLYEMYFPNLTTYPSHLRELIFLSPGFSLTVKSTLHKNNNDFGFFILQMHFWGILICFGHSHVLERDAKFSTTVKCISFLRQHY